MGDADLAIGFVQPTGAGFCGQRLFQDRFVCVFGSDHPRIGKNLSMDQFETEAHIAIATNGTGHSVVEDTLASNGIRRQIGLQVPSFLGLGPILTNTDLIAILPEQLGTYLARSGKIRLAELPVYIPPYFVYQIWHERVMHDHASRWFREGHRRSVSARDRRYRPTSLVKTRAAGFYSVSRAVCMLDAPEFPQAIQASLPTCSNLG